MEVGYLNPVCILALWVSVWPLNLTVSVPAPSLWGTCWRDECVTSLLCVCYTCMYTYVQVCSPMQGHGEARSWRWNAVLNCFYTLFFLLIVYLIDPVVHNVSQAGWAQSPGLLPQVPGSQTEAAVPVGTNDLKSDPHVYITSIWPTEPSAWSLHVNNGW